MVTHPRLSRLKPGKGSLSASTERRWTQLLAASKSSLSVLNGEGFVRVRMSGSLLRRAS